MRRAFQAHDAAIRFESVGSGDALFDLLEARSKIDEGSALRYPDLVILDLNLPRMSGTEILAKLRGEPNLIPVIVLSTSDSVSDISRSYRGGANAFFTKPATFADTKRVAASVASFWSTPGIKMVRSAFA